MGRSFRILILGVALLAMLGWFVLRQRHSSISRTTGSSTEGAVRTDPSVAAQAVGGAFSGFVRAIEGSAVAGARVCAANAGVHALGASASQCTVTNAEGRYVVTALNAGSYDVSAMAKGYLPGAIGKQKDILILPGQETKDVDFVLEHGGARLTGLVMDATGGPIEAARVDLSFGEPEPRNVSVESDAGGRFVAWLAPGRVGVTVSAAGYAQVLVAHMAPSSDLILRMTPGSTIRGTVVAAAKGTPVPGVEVRAACERCFASAASPSAISGSDGTFVVTGLDAGNYALFAEGDGVRGQGQGPVGVGIAQTVHGVFVVVASAVQVTGKVSLHDGWPCTRGTVSLGPPGVGVSMFDPPSIPLAPASHPLSGPPLVPAVAANIEETGAVRFRAVPKGTYHAVVQCAGQVLVDGPTTVQVVDANVEDLAWRVAPVLKLVVHVVDEASRPLGGANFRCTWPDRGEGGLRGTMMLTTDASGNHELPSFLYPGTYLLEPYIGHEGDPVSVDLREGMGKVEVTLRLKGTAAIEVKVQSAEGTPIDVVRVTVSAGKQAPSSGPTPAFESSEHAMSATTPRSFTALDATPLGDGRFRLEPLTAGAYDLEVDDGVNAPIRRAVQVSSGVVRQTIVLDRGQVLRGRVVDAAGQALPDIWVSAACTTSDGPPPELNSGDLAVSIFRDAKRVVTDAQGAFTVSGLSRAASSCTVTAEEPGGPTGTKEGAIPGQDIVIAMRPLGTLSGSAHTNDGRPIEQFMVGIVNAGTRQPRAQMVTSLGGSWTVPNVAPGNLKLFARNSAGEIAQRSVELAPGQSLNDVRLEFAPPPVPAPALAP